MERLIFLLLAAALLAGTLWAALTTGSAVLATVFIAVLLVTAAFYLIQFGPLKEFSLEALSAKAKFVRNTAVEVRSDAADIKRLKDVSEETAHAIKNIYEELDALRHDVNQAKIPKWQ